MQCHQCSGALTGPMTICPFCGVVQDIDLRKAHFRDLGPQSHLACPDCDQPLHSYRIETQPPLTFERCADCHGIFFNPGEVEAALDHLTTPATWVDREAIREITQRLYTEHQVRYRKCPHCHERMSPLNFGGTSGVILDRCGTHGLWLDNGELHRLSEWWRVGGRILHAASEEQRAGQLFIGAPGRPVRSEPRPDGTHPATTTPPPGDPGTDWVPWTTEVGISLIEELVEAIARGISSQ